MMPLFLGAQNVVLNNSSLTDITINNATQLTGVDTLFGASIPEAAHDSPTRDPPPRCFPGTRKQYVEDVISWALPAVGVNPLPTYWMKGPAGVGKSAVAQTCAEKLERQRKLGAAFFFSISRHSKNTTFSTDSTGDHYKFFTSIAYQLSTIYPEYRYLIDARIRHDKSLVHKTMQSQFRSLIFEPLRELEGKGLGIGGRIPIIVDGLDECESQEAQCEIVRIVTSAARDGLNSLCWAFFSRPEPHIESVFSRVTVSSLCYKTTLPISRDANKDVELYLRDGFQNILRRLNVTTASPWPSDNDMRKLVRAAGGLFIFAKTVLRFVGQSDSLNPEELLCEIIATISNHKQLDSTTGSPFAELDAFYILILQRIPDKIFPIIHRVFSILCLMPFSSAMMIANFVGIPQMTIEAACHQIAAVIRFQYQRQPLEFDPTFKTSSSFLGIHSSLTAEGYNAVLCSLGGAISFYHKSFHDFLQDPRRSGNYCIHAMNSFVHERAQHLTLQFERYHSWQGLELVRVPSAPDPAAYLSFPSQVEVVNSFAEAVLRCSGKNDFNAHFDFRKWLYVITSVAEALPLNWDVVKIILYGCNGVRKSVRGAMLCWLQPGEFLKFDVQEFKKNAIDKRRRENIVHPYQSTISFLNTSRGRVETGLYTTGQGTKAYFWYWEINYDLRTFRELRTIDLTQGEKLYRGQFGPKRNC